MPFYKLVGGRGTGWARDIAAPARTFFAAIFVMTASPVLAQTDAGEEAVAEEDGVKTYERDFFNRFNPQTALDIIERLPGFALDRGADLRGFGGAAGNVLIDGERPSSKVGGIEDALRRIPADIVARVDVIRGSAGLSEAAGQAVVANVIREKKQTAGSFEAKLERTVKGVLLPSGEVTVARQFGQWQTSTKLNALWDKWPLEGPRIQRDASGALTSSQLEDRPSILFDVFLSSEAKRPLAGGTLTLTGRFGRSAFLPDTERLGFDGRLPDSAPDDRLFIDFDSVFWEGEFGADWVKKFGGDWSFKLLSLSSFQDLDQSQDVNNERPVGTVNSGSLFIREQDSFETILRTAISKTGTSSFKPEFGGEITFNRVDNFVSLETRQGDTISPIALPAADVLVEEIRGEIYANAIWSLNDKLTLESGLAAELSEIKVTGDAESTQSFFFAKPFATLIYDLKQGIQLRLGARRTVGQLDFSEFASSASAEDDRVLGGNPQLGPDQTTRATFTLDMRSEKRGALNVELFHEWRDDVIEQVALPSGAFGAANVGSGRVWGVTSTAALILSPLIPGGLIEIEADVRDSTIMDPITGTRRNISTIFTPEILVEFRQDLTKHRVSWGASFQAISERTFFFGNEESFRRDGGQWRVFIETTRIKGLRVNLSMRNIGGRNFFRERRFFAPSRAGAFTGTETISRDRGMFTAITVTGQF